MPRLTFQEWKGGSQKQRRRYLRVLEESEDEDNSEPTDLFAAIAPLLRRVDFETAIPNWQAVQNNFDQLGAAQATWSSSSSRSSLVNDVLVRIDNIVSSRLQGVTDRLAELELTNRELQLAATQRKAHIPSNDVIRISGQAEVMRNILHPFTSVTLPPLPILLPFTDEFMQAADTYTSEDPAYDNVGLQAQGYEVFQVIDDFEHTLQRFFIQPYSVTAVASFGAAFNHYRQAITHFLDRDSSPI